MDPILAILFLFLILAGVYCYTHDFDSGPTSKGPGETDENLENINRIQSYDFWDRFNK